MKGSDTLKLKNLLDEMAWRSDEITYGFCCSPSCDKAFFEPGQSEFPEGWKKCGHPDDPTCREEGTFISVACPTCKDSYFKKCKESIFRKYCNDNKGEKYGRYTEESEDSDEDGDYDFCHICITENALWRDYGIGIRRQRLSRIRKQIFEIQKVGKLNKKSEAKIDELEIYAEILEKEWSRYAEKIKKRIIEEVS